MIKPEYRVANIDDLDTLVKMWDVSRIFHEKLDSRLSMIKDASSKVIDFFKELFQNHKLKTIKQGPDESIGGRYD
jgi:hypothetical protein